MSAADAGGAGYQGGGAEASAAASGSDGDVASDADHDGSYSGPLIAYLGANDPWRPTHKRPSRSPMGSFVAAVFLVAAATAYSANLIVFPSHATTVVTVNLAGCDAALAAHADTVPFASALGCTLRILAVLPQVGSEPPSFVGGAPDSTALDWGHPYRLVAARGLSDNEAPLGVIAAKVTEVLGSRDNVWGPHVPATSAPSAAVAFTGPRRFRELLTWSVVPISGVARHDVRGRGLHSDPSPLAGCDAKAEPRAYCKRPAALPELAACDPVLAAQCREVNALVDFADVSLGTLLSGRHVLETVLRAESLFPVVCNSSDLPPDSGFAVSVRASADVLAPPLLGEGLLVPAGSVQTLHARLSMRVVTNADAPSDVVDTDRLSTLLRHVPTVSTPESAMPLPPLSGAGFGAGANAGTSSDSRCNASSWVSDIHDALKKPASEPELWPHVRLGWVFAPVGAAQHDSTLAPGTSRVRIEMDPQIDVQFAGPAATGLSVYVIIGAGILSLFSFTGRLMWLMHKVGVKCRKWHASSAAARRSKSGASGAGRRRQLCGVRSCGWAAGALLVILNGVNIAVSVLAHGVAGALAVSGGLTASCALYLLSVVTTNKCGSFAATCFCVAPLALALQPAVLAFGLSGLPDLSVRTSLMSEAWMLIVGSINWVASCVLVYLMMARAVETSRTLQRAAVMRDPVLKAVLLLSWPGTVAAVVLQVGSALVHIDLASDRQLESVMTAALVMSGIGVFTLLPAAVVAWQSLAKGGRAAPRRSHAGVVAAMVASVTSAVGLALRIFVVVTTTADASRWMPLRGAITAGQVTITITAASIVVWLDGAGARARSVAMRAPTDAGSDSVATRATIAHHGVHTGPRGRKSGHGADRAGEQATGSGRSPDDIEAPLLSAVHGD